MLVGIYIGIVSTKERKPTPPKNPNEWLWMKFLKSKASKIRFSEERLEQLALKILIKPGDIISAGGTPYQFRGVVISVDPVYGIKIKWDELDAYRLFPRNDCGLYTYNSNTNKFCNPVIVWRPAMAIVDEMKAPPCISKIERYALIEKAHAEARVQIQREYDREIGEILDKAIKGDKKGTSKV